MTKITTKTTQTQSASKLKLKSKSSSKLDHKIMMNTLVSRLSPPAIAHYDISSESIEKIETPCLVLGFYSSNLNKNNHKKSYLFSLSADLEKLEEKAGDHYFSSLLSNAGITDTLGQSLLITEALYPEALKNKIKAKKLLLIHCGKSEGVNEHQFSKLFRTIADKLSNHQVTEAAFSGDLLNLNLATAYPNIDTQNLSRKAILSILAISTENYRFDLFKTSPVATATKKHIYLSKIYFCIESKAKNKSEIQAGIKTGQIMAQAMIQTRHLGNLPSNICTPDYLAQEALEIAKTHGKKVKLKIYSEAALAELGMNCLLGVGKGSSQESHLIVLEYQGLDAKTPPHAIVGKGVTFDSGGLCIKPRQNMSDMKMDMCGAASVLSTFNAAVALNLKINLLAVVPTVENMPDGNALQPGNILKSHQGIYVEIVDTDAEGRLILSDAISHATEFNPQTILTTATLTGAIITALGHHRAGAFTNNQPLVDLLIQAGFESNDLAWQLPLDELYQEQINSEVADIANLGKDNANSITAAAFLSRFVKNIPWVHLDIAGTAMLKGGATGRPTPLLIQYLINLEKNNKK